MSGRTIEPCHGMDENTGEIAMRRGLYHVTRFIIEFVALGALTFVAVFGGLYFVFQYLPAVV